jgi:hypothetical protein
MQSVTLMGILTYIFDACIATAMQLFILMGVGLILGFLIHKLSRAIQSHAGSVFPICLYAYLFLIPGFTLHELSHWLFAKLFGFTVSDVVLFQCKPDSPYGGYIKRSGPRDFIQQIGLFFIGVAPIVLGVLAVFALSHVLLGPGVFAGVSFTLELGDSPNLLVVAGRLYESVVLTTGRVFGQLVALRGVPGWKVWLFLYLAFSFSNAMNLSPSDLQSTASGLTVIAAILLAINLVLMSGGQDVLRLYVVELSQLYSSFYTIMLFALSLNVIAAIIVVPLGIMFRRTV